MIGYRALPLAARIRAKLFGNSDVRDYATETIELAPEITRAQPAAISLPNEIDRIVAFQEETIAAIEFARLQSGQHPHGATVAYRIDNAVLGQGNLYFDGGHQVLRPRSAKPLLPRDADYFEEAQLCTHFAIERYFGHWVRDGLLLELLASQRSTPALTNIREPWLHEPGYRELSGLKAEATDHARVEKLWVIDDRGVNDSWIERFQELRRRMRSAAKSSGPKRVMLVRGRLGASRELVNNNELQAALETLGFEIITPETETVRRIVEKLAHAEIAVFVEGSVQNHCLLAMPVGSTLLTIQPASRFNAHSKSYADPIGLHWAYVIADVASGGFRLPVDRLLRTIDEVMRVAEARR